MKLSAPKVLTLLIAFLLVVAGIILNFVAPTFVVPPLWFAVAGFVLLALGTLLKGL